MRGLPTFRAAWQCVPSWWDRVLGRTWVVVAIPTSLSGSDYKGWQYDLYEAVPFDIALRRSIAFGPVTRRFAERKVQDQRLALKRHLERLP